MHCITLPGPTHRLPPIHARYHAGELTRRLKDLLAEEACTLDRRQLQEFMRPVNLQATHGELVRSGLVGYILEDHEGRLVVKGGRPEVQSQQPGGGGGGGGGRVASASANGDLQNEKLRKILEGLSPKELRKRCQSAGVFEDYVSWQNLAREQKSKAEMNTHMVELLISVEGQHAGLQQFRDAGLGEKSTDSMGAMGSGAHGRQLRSAIAEQEGETVEERRAQKAAMKQLKHLARSGDNRTRFLRK